jgi:hypothetical protein
VTCFDVDVGGDGGVAPAFPAPVPGSDPPVTSTDAEVGGAGGVAPGAPAPVPGSDPPVNGSDVEVGGAGVWHLLSLYLYLEVILL